MIHGQSCRYPDEDDEQSTLGPSTCGGSAPHTCQDRLGIISRFDVPVAGNRHVLCHVSVPSDPTSCRSSHGVWLLPLGCTHFGPTRILPSAITRGSLAQTLLSRCRRAPGGELIRSVYRKNSSVVARVFLQWRELPSLGSCSRKSSGAEGGRPR